MTIDEFLAAAIEDFRTADVWDDEPTLALLCRTPAGRLAGVLAFPETIWSLAGHPRRALRVMTQAVKELGTPPLLHGFELVGLVLVSEGYGISDPDRPEGWWDTHRIADDPDGYEYVSAIAVDLEGAAYGRFYRRGDDEASSNIATTGALVDELRELLKALRAPISEPS